MDWGGSPDIVRILCERVNPKLYDTKLIYGPSTHISNKNKDFLKRFKENIFYIPYLKREINISADIFTFLSLYRLFRKERFDIVHTHTAKAGVVGRVAARLAGTRFIIHSPHGHNFYGYFTSLVSKMVVILERFLAHFTDRIIALTELVKRDFATYKVARPEKIAVIRSGLELDDYKKVDVDVRSKRDELKIGQDAILVGMIGRLEHVKGPEYFIEAAKLVIERFPKVNFLIVGEGALRNKLESRSKDLGISDKLIFTGWREDIPEILATLDILVLPSLNEAVGRILLEAGAFGIPVVATNIGGVPEIVRDNESGILIPPKDADRLAETIILLSEDKEKRQKMGKAAKNWVDDKFSAETMVDKISNLYQEAMRSEKI